MKKTLLFAILMSVATFIHATNIVSQEDAKIAAKNFMIELCQNETISLDFFALNETVTDANGYPVYYNFNMANRGFILVSATTLIAPVLAYSFESRFEENERTSYFVKKYKHTIQQVRKNPELREISATAEWDHYLASDFSPVKTRATGFVEPLLPTTWDQSRYYNQYCPYDPAARGSLDLRTYVGCVALTLTNLLYYYRYPSTLAIGATYYHDNYGALSAEQYTHYNYDYITDNINAYQYEFAKLVHHAGVTVQMNYGTDGSGVIVENGGIPVGGRMGRHWDFYPGIYESRESNVGDISYDEWEKMVMIELDAQRPLFYDGSSNEGGHAWIIDGYIRQGTTNYFHANWGWGGGSNGFYKLDGLTTQGQGNYSNREGMYKRLAPDSVAIMKPMAIDKRLTGLRGSISDGAGNAGYPLQAEYKWTVATPGATSYTLIPKKIKILADDIITIYANNSDGTFDYSNPIEIWKGEYLMPGCTDNSGTQQNVGYSGTPLPSDLVIIGDSILVHFKSVTPPNDTTQFSTHIARHLTGININYIAKYPVGAERYCLPSAEPLVNPNGTISDKRSSSGVEQDEPYRAETQCQWNISLNANIEDQTAIEFSFDYLDLGEGDVIDIYSNSLTQSNARFLFRIDKNSNPNEIRYHEGSRLHIRFNADNYDEGTGFILKYNARKATGISPIHAGLNELSLYPNPTSDKLYTELSTDNVGIVTLQILDLTGRIFSTEIINHAGGELKYETSVTELSAGMYFMKVNTEQGAITRKFIVK